MNRPESQRADSLVRNSIQQGPEAPPGWPGPWPDTACVLRDTRFSGERPNDDDNDVLF